MSERTTPDMDLARAAMDARHRPLDAGRRARLWADIEAAREADAPARRWVPLAMLGAAAAAAIAAMVLVRAAPAAVLRAGELRAGAEVVARDAAVPTRVPLVATTRATLAVAGAEITLESGARVTVDEAARALVLEGGSATLAGEAAEWSVVTAEARLAWTGARVRLARAAGATRVTVEAGEIDLEARGGGVRRLRAREVVEVAPAGRARSGTPLAPPSGAASGPAITPRASGAAEGAPAVALHDPARVDGVGGSAQRAASTGPEAAPTSEAAARPADRLDAVERPIDDAPRTDDGHDARALEEARRVAALEPARARLIAQGVLDARPRPEVRVDAQMVVADALRRQGDRVGAARMYDRVATSADAGPFLEEALFREAQLLAELARTEDALALLATADRERPAGLLRPERVALTAALHLARRDLDGAARVLEAAADVDTLATQRARLDVGRALVDVAPERAARLVGPALRSASPEVAARARQLADRIPPGSVPKIADPAER